MENKETYEYLKAYSLQRTKFSKNTCDKILKMSRCFGCLLLYCEYSLYAHKWM